ncbi:MAG: hypothetical protein P8X67_13835 [Syntrophobacterales bacterium]
MNHLLRPRIWPFFQASSGVGPCDAPLKYGNQSRGTAGRLPGGTPIFVVSPTAIHKISGLDQPLSTVDGKRIDRGESSER